MEPQVRLGKVRSGQDRVGNGVPAQRLARSRYGWVRLSDEEYGRLLTELGEQELQRCIEYVDESAQATGNKNKWSDWNLVLRRCHRDRWGIPRLRQSCPAVTAPSGYADEDEFDMGGMDH